MTESGTASPAGTRIVSAVFHDVDDTEEAYRAAVERGYAENEITVLMSEQARDRYFPSETVEIEHTTLAREGTGIGGAVGAGIGALAGALAAIGTVVAIPPLGIVIAGPLAAGLLGAGAGGVAGGVFGGVLGALVGAGVDADRARVYQTAIEKGGIVLAVQPRSEADAAALAEAWEACGGDEVYRA